MHPRSDPSRPYPTSEEIRYAYEVERLSTTEMASRWGVCKGHVRKMTRKAGCPPRDRHNLPSQYHRVSVLANEPISDRQEEIILGTLLGDGSLSNPLRSGSQYLLNSNLQVLHSSIQQIYVEWLHKELENISHPIHSYDHKDGKRVYFNTAATPYFTDLRSQFYPGGKKIFPRSLYEAASPLTLAVWFMDDGTMGFGETNHRCPFVYFCTDGFARHEVENLQDWLLTGYGIRSTINLSNKILFRLRIGSKEVNHFRDLISPYVIPEMYYKLDW